MLRREGEWLPTWYDKRHQTFLFLKYSHFFWLHFKKSCSKRLFCLIILKYLVFTLLLNMVFMKFTTFTMLVPLFFSATRTHLFPNNSIVSKILLNILELMRYSIISFILFCPLLLQHKLLSWNPLYFCSKLEHLWGQASIFFNYRKCC